MYNYLPKIAGHHTYRIIDDLVNKGGIAVAATTLTAEPGNDSLKLSKENSNKLKSLGESANATAKYYGITDNVQGLTDKEAKHFIDLVNARRARGLEKKFPRSYGFLSEDGRRGKNTNTDSLTLLFQTEKELLDEAQSFDTWEEFMQFYKTTSTEDTLIPSIVYLPSPISPSDP